MTDYDYKIKSKAKGKQLLNYNEMITCDSYALNVSDSELSPLNIKENYEKTWAKFANPHIKNTDYSRGKLSDKEYGEIFDILIPIYRKQWNNTRVAHKGITIKQLDKLLEKGEFSEITACTASKGVAEKYGNVIITFPKDSVRIGTPGQFPYKKPRPTDDSIGFTQHHLGLAEGRIPTGQKLPKKMNIHFRGTESLDDPKKIEPFSPYEKKQLQKKYSKYRHLILYFD